MDIVTAERALTRYAARKSGLTPDRTVLRGNGDLTEAPTLVRVRFVSGRPAGPASLAELVAELRGVFAEPEEAHAFADAVWGTLPEYGAEGFTELAAEGVVEFAAQNGYFTATGRIKACFA